MGRIVQKAMKMGFTGYRVKKTSTGEAATGDATNLTLGGGAGIVTRGDDIAMSGSSGLGWSSAEAWKEVRPEIMLEVFLAK